MATLDAGTSVAAEPNVSEATGAAAKVVELPSSDAHAAVRTRAHLTWAAATSAVLLFALLLLRWLPSVGWPVVLAFIGAYLFDPVVTWIARRGVQRTIASGVLVAFGGVFVAGVVVLAVPTLLSQAAKLPHFITSAIDIVLARMSTLGNKALPEDFEALLQMAREHVPDILTNVLPSAGGMVAALVGGSLSALSVLLSAVVVPVVGFFLMNGWPEFLVSVETLVPGRQRPFFRERMKEVDRVLNGFIRGQLTMAAVLATLYGAGLSVVGLKLAFVVGLVTGFGNIVPYVGTACGLLLAVISCIVDFGVDYHLPVTILVFSTILILDSVFITPKIVGNRVGLSPAAVIVAVLACGSLFGFGGVLLAVPTVATLKIVMRVMGEAWRESQYYKEG
jgi:predicted PurR-regulated permease PerM